MPKSLTQIQKAIDRLQAEADALRKKEAGSVIARIKEAISHYNLTPQDLFGGQGAAAKRKPSRPAGVRKGPKGKKRAGVVKYRDDQGNTWTGHGRRPQWFIDAVASGKRPEDLAA